MTTRTVALGTIVFGMALGCESATDQSAGPGSDNGADAIATYTVTLETTWSASTHPNAFPSNPHFSGLIGGTHNGNAVIWQPGTTASTGIKDMAELGSKTALENEVNNLITLGTARGVLSGGGIGRSPGSVELTFEIHEDFPLVSLTSMLAPSPDWFVGVSGLNLRQNGEWRQSVTVPLAVYDAGTDSGVIYTAPNTVTNPPRSITLLTASPFDQQAIVGAFRFVRQ